jgi:integrase/recombinase XerC
MRRRPGSPSVEDHRLAPGAAGLHVVAGLVLLRPEEQVFAAMLDGWGSQQLAATSRPGPWRAASGRCGRSPPTAGRTRGRGRRRWPTSGAPTCAPCAGCGARRCAATRWPCGCFAPTSPTRPTTGPRQCQRRFGTHPVQVVHEWNAAVHAQQVEAEPSKRAFTLEELQAFFDHADAQVARIRAAGRKGSPARLPGRGGVQGRRRLRAAPQRGAHAGRGRLRPQPHGRSSPGYGTCYVRHGKATTGSAPKPRSMLTLWAWVPEVLQEWVTQFRPLLAPAGNPVEVEPTSRSMSSTPCSPK